MEEAVSIEGYLSLFVGKQEEGRSTIRTNSIKVCLTNWGPLYEFHQPII